MYVQALLVAIYSLAADNFSTIIPFLAAIFILILSFIFEGYRKATYAYDATVYCPETSMNRNFDFDPSEVFKELPFFVFFKKKLEFRTCSNNLDAFTTHRITDSEVSIAFVNVLSNRLTKETFKAGVVLESLAIKNTSVFKSYYLEVVAAVVFMLAYCIFYALKPMYRSLKISRPHPMMRHVISMLGATLTFCLFRLLVLICGNGVVYANDSMATLYVRRKDIAEFLLRMCIESRRFPFKHPFFPLFPDFYAHIGERIKDLVRLWPILQ